MYYYNLNTRHNCVWRCAFISTMKKLKMDRMRLQRTICGIRNELDQLPTIWNAGWHMSFFGDALFIQNKLLSYAHMEHAVSENTDLDVIESRIKTQQEPFTREAEHAHFKLYHVPTKDNSNLPPKYETYLRGFYDE